MLLLRLEELPRTRPRHWTPLFSDDDGAPLVSREIDQALIDTLFLFSPQAAAGRSWYSYRVRLASKLRAARTPLGGLRFSDSTIQALSLIHI